MNIEKLSLTLPVPREGNHVVEFFSAGKLKRSMNGLYVYQSFSFSFIDPDLGDQKVYAWVKDSYSQRLMELLLKTQTEDEDIVVTVKSHLIPGSLGAFQLEVKEIFLQNNKVEEVEEVIPF